MKFKSPLVVQYEITPDCPNHCEHCYNYWNYGAPKPQDANAEKIAKGIVEADIDPTHIKVTLIGHRKNIYKKL
tara:strand:- start:265 stop:483 length:219 start_codon:yes stop_codon:yes gene_type:complete